MRIVRYGAWPFHNLFNICRRETGIQLHASAVPNSRVQHTLQPSGCVLKSDAINGYEFKLLNGSY
jgi:hypothetical protein